MANTLQAKKRARQSEIRRQHNTGFRSGMRTQVKKVIKAVESGDKAVAQAAYKVAVPALDKVAGKNIIKKNKAARHKRRLNARIKAMG